MEIIQQQEAISVAYKGLVKNGQKLIQALQQDIQQYTTEEDKLQQQVQALEQQLPSLTAEDAQVSQAQLKDLQGQYQQVVQRREEQEKLLTTVEAQLPHVPQPSIWATFINYFRTKLGLG